jgi:hypothetical protein
MTTEVNIKNKNDKVTKSSLRKIEDSTIYIQILKDVLKKFFPNLIRQLDELDDERQSLSITYSTAEILMMVILGLIFQVESMNSMDENFNNTIAIQNFYWLLDKVPKTQLPDRDTISRVLRKLDPSTIEKIQTAIVHDLINSGRYNASKILGKYWPVHIDATQQHNFGIIRHCDKCLTRKHRKKKNKYNNENTNKFITYYHHAMLVATIDLDGMEIPLASESIENEKQFPTKQDCELTSFKDKLAPKIRENFPRLNICNVTDSLYPNNPYLKICEQYNMKVLSRFKKGSIPSVYNDFEKNVENGTATTYYFNDINKSTLETDAYQCFNTVYGSHEVNIVRYIPGPIKKDEWLKRNKRNGIQEDAFYSYTSLTNLPLNEETCVELTEGTRGRWGEENGFNTLKNRGYALSHIYVNDPNAMQNMWYLIEIAFTISQVMEHHYSKFLTGISVKSFHQRLFESFRNDSPVKEQASYKQTFSACIDGIHEALKRLEIHESPKITHILKLISTEVDETTSLDLPYRVQTLMCSVFEFALIEKTKSTYSPQNQQLLYLPAPKNVMLLPEPASETSVTANEPCLMDKTDSFETNELDELTPTLQAVVTIKSTEAKDQQRFRTNKSDIPRMVIVTCVINMLYLFSHTATATNYSFQIANFTIIFAFKRPRPTALTGAPQTRSNGLDPTHLAMHGLVRSKHPPPYNS